LLFPFSPVEIRFHFLIAQADVGYFRQALTLEILRGEEVPEQAEPLLEGWSAGSADAHAWRDPPPSWEKAMPRPQPEEEEEHGWGVEEKTNGEKVEVVDLISSGEEEEGVGGELHWPKKPELQPQPQPQPQAQQHKDEGGGGPTVIDLDGNILPSDNGGRRMEGDGAAGALLPGPALVNAGEGLLPAKTAVEEAAGGAAAGEGAEQQG